MITPQEAALYLPEIYGLLPTYAFKVTREVIDAAPNLRIVANYGVGYDNVDAAYAASRGIVVTNNPRPVVEPTGELAFALMIAAARRVSENDRKLRHGSAEWGLMDNLGVSLHRKTLGIFGMGHIGRVVARYAQGAEMTVLYCNRRRLSPEVEQRYNARHVTLEELLQESDCISINSPLTPETRHTFSAPQFAAMKPSAIIVNTARGAIIDEAALVEALQKAQIAGAALDVFENEPYITPALLGMDNVVLAPHAGTSTLEARNTMSREAAENIIRFHAGRTDIYRVN